MLIIKIFKIANQFNIVFLFFCHVQTSEDKIKKKRKKIHLKLFLVALLKNYVNVM